MADSSYDERVREIARARADKAPDPQGDRVSADRLLGEELGELVWTIDGMLPEGLSLLIGAPKMRKSFLVTSLGVAVACGGFALGALQVASGDVLHLALEDGKRRVQSRLRTMLNGDTIPPGRLTYQFSHEVGIGIRGIEEWLQLHPNARLVVIDTWQRFRDLANEIAHVNAYERDYEAARQIQALALRYHVCILLVHHKKKGASGDWLESVSGSMGLPAACDTVWLLERKRGEDEAQLDVTGRDVEEEQYGLRWDNEHQIWSLLGRIDDTLTGETREVLGLLDEAVEEGISPRQIAEELGILPATARKRLSRLRDRNLVTRTGKFPKTKYRISEAGMWALKEGKSVTQSVTVKGVTVPERDQSVTPIVTGGEVTLSNTETEEIQDITPERDTVTPYSLTRAKKGVDLTSLESRDITAVTLETESSLRALIGPVAHARGVSIAAVLGSMPKAEWPAYLENFQDNPDTLAWWVEHKVQT